MKKHTTIIFTKEDEDAISRVIDILDEIQSARNPQDAFEGIMPDIRRADLTFLLKLASGLPTNSTDSRGCNFLYCADTWCNVKFEREAE